MNEAETRADHIDPALTAAGWGVVEGSRIRREFLISPGRLEGKGRHAAPLLADYVLTYRGKNLAVVEAKAWDLPLTTGLAQAKNYADKMAVRYTYATNGQGFYAVDMHTGTEGPIQAFPSPSELWGMTFTQENDWRNHFGRIPYEDKGGNFPPRYYQDTAVDRVLEAIAAKQNRILLTLATGTGKTFIAFQIAWKLFHSRWNLGDWNAGTAPSRRPRILFLADRNVLADQAFNAFSAFPEDALKRIDPSEISKKGAVPKNASVFFTIFQTFMSGTNKSGDPAPHFGEYPPDFFDFIVVDECHRGGARDESNWRGILEYFSPAVQLGLTATPKRNENVDTYAYFGDPVYIYSLKEGINDGFLSPFRVRQITSSLDEYVYTDDDHVIEGALPVGAHFTESDFNKIIEIKEREADRVKQFMDSIDQREKTIVFCATQMHALAVRDIINQTKTSTDPNYCQRVTADDGKLGDQHLRAFQDNEKTIPTILTTSEKLATGVDARNIRNIVLMRPINSIIEFKQIVGRGTRLYEGKDYFTVYDFVNAHQHFNDPEWDGEPLEPEPAAVPGGIGEGPEAPTPGDDEDPTDGNTAPPKIEIKLADGKARTIQHMVVTTFWHPDGKPMSAQQFLEELFGKLPDFFKDESELRALWSDPATRIKLLEGLAEQGFGAEQLSEMQRLIDAENSDIFDVLAHVAYALQPITRDTRAANARISISTHFDSKRQAFLDFVLAHYVSEGVDELDPSKLVPLLNLRYGGSIADAVTDLGDPKDIAFAFAGFQKYLYEAVA
jgi:type I restriction enzyme R subunit